MTIAFPATRRLAYGLLCAALALLPARSDAQELIGDNVITLGTTKAKVDQLLGNPHMGWSINCLCRAMYTYPDGSKVIFVDERAISARPNGLAKGSPETGLIVERSGKQVIFEPIILCGVPLHGPGGDLRRQVEECFFMAPPSHSLEVTLQPLWATSGWPRSHFKAKSCAP